MNSYYSNELAGSVEDINLSEIVLPPSLLRINLNGIEELAESIKHVGLLQPIIVRVNDAHSFEIVAGYRRFNACKKIGWRKITCHIVELDDKTSFEVSLIENVQRQTLNPIEEGLAFRNYVNKFGWGGVSDLAEKISKSPGYVSKRIRLVELPDSVIDLLSKCEISISAAEELLPISSRGEQTKIAIVIRNKKLPLRKVRQLLKNSSIAADSDSLSSSLEDNPLYTKDRILKSIDKSIITLRIAVKKLGEIMERVEDDWIFYGILLYQRNVLISQIDLLIKQKRKYKKPYFDRHLRECLSC
ncbi:MAG TPA: ParB/RepB/Spo0J family partition protein [Nitrososphaeraceae archaeon]|nr:ParB/RepB/Spo0J family partition protein [Nitrososphaeraceae archaeon]